MKHARHGAYQKRIKLAHNDRILRKCPPGLLIKLEVWDAGYDERKIAPAHLYSIWPG